MPIKNSCVYKDEFESEIGRNEVKYLSVKTANPEQVFIDITCSKKKISSASIAIFSIYWLIIFMIVIYCYRILKKLRLYCELEQDSEKSKRKKELCRRIFNYPIVLVLSFIFCSIHRFYLSYYIGQEFKNEHLARLGIIFMLVNGLYSNIRGFLIFLVIGCQNNVKTELAKISGKFFGLKETKENEVQGGNVDRNKLLI